MFFTAAKLTGMAQNFSNTFKRFLYKQKKKWKQFRESGDGKPGNREGLKSFYLLAFWWLAPTANSRFLLWNEFVVRAVKL